ncbi:TetR/AcrR family transcriptional regulator [Mycolicibacterium komossense]|uniref:TetR family transcriptional regulator n=1 Tax=Mycolicibacterium komossense TaxID=1779 RepID=A0ABT3CEY3_9MYCO|nr:TetR/AcrR family transcriptional regulator [Mycolicibacterium komossense]MCV7228035.1 TetR family transcriptional regulator [Mycolicibacterium komossense]
MFISSSPMGTAESPPGLRERKKLQTWRDIRAAAIRLLRDHDFADVSVDMIAAEANVSRATFFNYFASKDAVVFDADPEELAAYRSLLDTRPDHEPVWTSLQQILVATVDSASEQIVVQHHVLQRNPTLAGGGRTYGDQFRHTLIQWATQRAVAAGSTEFQAALMVATADAAATTAYRFWDPASGTQALRDLITAAFGTTAPYSSS